MSMPYTACVRPLHQVLGEDWREVDMLRITEADIYERLLVEPSRGQAYAMAAAIKRVVRAMMPRARIKGAFRLGRMEQYYRENRVTIGEAGQLMLDALFAEPGADAVTEPLPEYRYPLATFSGIAWRAPVTDHNAGQLCQMCRYLDECYRIVTQRDGLALCEAILADEIIPDEVLHA